MDKLGSILKNTLLFLVIFISLNFIFQSCQSKEEEKFDSSSPISIETTKLEYSRVQTVNVEIRNNQDSEITITSNCPENPLRVLKKEGSEWIKITANPNLDCSTEKDLVIPGLAAAKINYDNWNYSLFGEMGTFKIEYDLNIDDEIQTFSSNEFYIVEEGILKKLWYAVFYKPIYNLLALLISILPGHYLGLAIILLTLIIRTILLLPNQKAMRSQQKLQELQPRLDKIKEKYKGDQQKISMETMNLWKEAKVNPFGSCLPMLLQFPFLIALFYVIKSGLNPDKTYLLYTSYENFSIDKINVFLFGLDLTKINLYVLPIVIGALQFFQIKLSLMRKKDSKKAKTELEQASSMMLYFMPVMIAVFTASVPAGVGIYWGVSTIYGILQQSYINHTSGSNKESKSKVKVYEVKEKK